MLYRRTVSRWFIAAAGIVAAACASDSTSPRVATTLTLSASTISLDAIGATQTITAAVTDQRGEPMLTAPVSWSSSSASVTVTSGTSGTATITSAGNGTATITASTGGASATVYVSVAQIPAAVQKTTGDAQLGAVNTTLVQPIGVRVVDRLGVAIANQTVSFAVTAGAGSVAAGTVSTASDGTASTTWTLGKIASTAEQVTATVGSLAPIAFNATAVAGSPVTVMVAAGNGQTGSVGSMLSVAPQVLVLDAFTNPIAGATVSFAPAAGGSVQFASATTNASGIASAGGWTLPTTPGTKTLVAIAGTAAPVTFTATAVTATASVMSIVAGNNQSATVNAAVATAPSVRVSDAFGNAVSGATVTFSVASGAGTVVGGSVASDANGIAAPTRWILGATAGTNTLTASVANVPVVTFTATATAVTTTPTTPGSTGALVIVAGSNQAAMAGGTLPVAPTVIVRDSNGNPISGVAVTFSVSAGGGSLSSTSAVTNASGVASAGNWRLGSTASLNTVTAAANGYGVLTFTAAGCEGAGGASFAITLCYRTSMTPTQRAAFVNAAARWRSIITSKLPDVTLNIAEGSCDDGTPALSNFTVDDLLIFAAIQPIDGAGNILGSAGWCLRRTAGLPVVGSMNFDAADMAQLETNGELAPVILHEMGHVLGIGTMWSAKGLLQLPSSPTSMLDTYFSGALSVAAFNTMGGTAYTGGHEVPVENSGGPGTMNSHWRESVLHNELMTGYINSGTNPLSVLTVQSLADLGYTVNAAGADPFAVAFAAPGANLQLLDAGGVSLMNDTYTGPQATVDASGRVTRIR